jgi:hypothetical protein
MNSAIHFPMMGQVWHNYSFDRAVFGNHGIDVRGFGGDTMHMARLWSAARIRGYSLEALSKDLTSSSKVMRRPCSVLSSGRVLVLCRFCFLFDFNSCRARLGRRFW